MFPDPAAPMKRPALKPITVRRAHGEAAFLDFAPTWRELFAASPEATPFQSWEWISSWWRNRGRGEPLLLVACAGETPIAAMALVRTRYHGLPVYSLKWMGAPDSDYQDFVGVERRDDCAAAFLADLARSRDWHFCELGALRADLSTLLSRAPGVAASVNDFCMTTPLTGGRAGFDQALGRHRRKAIRRRFNLLQSERGAHSFSTVATLEELGPAMHDLFRLHEQRREMVGHGGAFADAGAQAFHLAAAAEFLARDWLRLHQFLVGDRCIAVAYCFHLRDVTYLYQSGFDPEFARYSPGVALIQHAIHAAIDEGAKAFDFMRGVEDYKTGFRAEPFPNGHMIFGRPSLVSRAAVASRRLEREIWRRLQARRNGAADMSDAVDES